MVRQYQEKLTLTKAELKTLSSLKITIESGRNKETQIKKSKQIYYQEIAALRSDVRNLKYSNIDLVRLFTSNHNYPSKKQETSVKDIGKENLPYRDDLQKITSCHSGSSEGI